MYALKILIFPPLSLMSGPSSPPPIQHLDRLNVSLSGTRNAVLSYLSRSVDFRRQTSLVYALKILIFPLGLMSGPSSPPPIQHLRQIESVDLSGTNAVLSYLSGSIDFRGAKPSLVYALKILIFPPLSLMSGPSSPPPIQHLDRLKALICPVPMQFSPTSRDRS